MKDIIESILESILPPIPNRKDWRIGCIGAGFIMSDCHLDRKSTRLNSSHH